MVHCCMCTSSHSDFLLCSSHETLRHRPPGTILNWGDHCAPPPPQTPSHSVAFVQASTPNGHGMVVFPSYCKFYSFCSLREFLLPSMPDIQGQPDCPICAAGLAGCGFACCYFYGQYSHDCWWCCVRHPRHGHGWAVSGEHSLLRYAALWLCAVHNCFMKQMCRFHMLHRQANPQPYAPSL